MCLVNLDGCCRGSLIRYEGKAWIVTGEWFLHGRRSSSVRGYRAVQMLPNDELLVGQGMTFMVDVEVDLCFPGPVFKHLLHDFIK
jgi:hypothetical protein